MPSSFKFTPAQWRLFLLIFIPVAAVTYLIYNRFAAFGPPPSAAIFNLAALTLPVEATPVTRSSLTQVLEVVGQVEASQGVELAAEISGRISAIPFTEGQPVTSGTLLFQLDDSIQRAALAQARASYSVMQNNALRADRLLTQGAVSTQAAESARAEANLAAANVQFALANLGKTRIRAPFNGIAGLRQASVGDYVTPGKPLVSITQNQHLKITFSVPESNAAGLAAGQDITILTHPEDKEGLPASITAIDGRIDPATRTVGAQTTLPPEYAEQLKSGQFVRVLVPTQQASNSIIIPNQALVPAGTQTFVFVVTPQLTASKTAIITGLQSNNQVEVLSGLNEGDLLITAGQHKLQQGFKVKPVTPTTILPARAPVEPLD